MSLLDNVLTEALCDGRPFFAVDRNKRPLTPNGFYGATTDPETLTRMFADPRAEYAAMPTGSASGIFAIDIDPDGVDWHYQNAGELGNTFTYQTRRGGCHRLYHWQEGLGCTAGRIAAGVDSRGSLGYVVRWDMSGFPLLDQSPIGAVPPTIVSLIQAAKPAIAEEAAQPKNPEELSPPSADALLLLLRTMPNPLEADRGVYEQVMLATQGAIRGGVSRGLLSPEQVEDVHFAAASWAERWEGGAPDFAEELTKWEKDWSKRTRDVSGWRNLLSLASQLGADVSEYATATAAAEFASAPLPAEAPKPAATDDQRTALNDLMSIETWADCDIPEPDRLLGDMLTTTTRGFFVGRTGLGKTMFGMGMACGVAAGAGFLQWPPGRPAKVLFVDGEMPAELIKPRAIEAMRRLGCPIPRHNLVIFGRDIDDKAHEVFPALPPFAPLNTDAGHRFLFALIDAVGDVDVLFLDNVMSLLAGDQKDEVTWSGVNELVQQITLRRIGQVWFDHTGHNSDRQYGSSTKAWKFDVVGVMTPLPDRADARETAFNLSFDHPGKARRRTPDNWQEFQDQTIRLVDDRWTFEPVQKATEKAADSIKPSTRAQYEALMTLLSLPGATGGVTREAWYLECVRQGLHGPIPADANGRDRGRITGAFRASMSDLKVAGWIDVNGENVTSTRGFR